MLKITQNLFDDVPKDKELKNGILITEKNKEDFKFSGHRFYIEMADTSVMTNKDLTYIQIENLLGPATKVSKVFVLDKDSELITKEIKTEKKDETQEDETVKKTTKTEKKTIVKKKNNGKK